MRGIRLVVLVGCFMVSALGASAAEAGGSGKAEGSGTIAFVGAIVEPTCNISAAPDLVGAVTGASAVGAPLSRQRNCSGSVSAQVTASPIYSASVVHLSDSEPDQVLRYFAGYVRATQSSNADPVLLTQTYE